MGLKSTVVIDKESLQVGRLATRLAVKLGASSLKTAQEIGLAAVLHDVGKAQIPTEILNKPGKLTEVEMEIMKNHTKYGFMIFRDSPGKFGKMVRNITLYHHEWFNGDGYWRKMASQLPDYVSITAICDVFVALINPRVYKKAWPVEEALAYIEEQADRQFSRELVRTFVSLMTGEVMVPEEERGRVDSIFEMERVASGNMGMIELA